MSDCPDCGGHSDRPRWAPGGCTCRRQPEPDGGEDVVDEALEVASKWDYFTPGAELAGANKYVLVLLALFLILLVFLSHGTLWG